MHHLRTAPMRRRARRSGLVASAILGILLGLLGAGATTVRADDLAAGSSKMVGFKVLTAEGGAKVAANAVVVTYEGPIAYPMGENLRAIWDEVSIFRACRRPRDTSICSGIETSTAASSIFCSRRTTSPRPAPTGCRAANWRRDPMSSCDCCQTGSPPSRSPFRRAESWGRSRR